MSIPEDIELLIPWQVIPLAQSGRSQSLSAELQREMCPGNVLHGLRANAVAVRNDHGDVLFEVEGGAMPLAVVHLTWQTESDPQWPTTELFESWDQWVRDAVNPAHEEYVQSER